MAGPETFSERFQYRPVSDVLGYNSYDLQNPGTIRELAYKAYIVAGETEYNGQKGIIVEAWMPETLATDIAANYEAPLAQGLNGMLPGLGAIARFAGVNLTTQALTAQIWQGGGHIQFSIPFIFQAETSAAAEVMEPIKQLFTLTLPKDPAGGGLLQAPGPHIDFDALLENTGRATSAYLKKQASNASQAVRNRADQAVKFVTGFMKDPAATAVSVNSELTSKDAVSFANDVAQVTSDILVNSVKNNISLYLGQFMYFPSVVIKDVNPTFDVVLATDKNPMRAVVNINFETFFVPTSRDIETMFPATAANRQNARGG